MPSEKDFPLQDEMYPGAVRSFIWHSFFTAMMPSFAHEKTWAGDTYCTKDSQGARGAVTFAKDAFFAAVFTSHSSRNPYPTDNQSSVPYTFAPYLESLPASLQDLAENRTLRYLVDDYDGKVQPVITTAFWGQGKGSRFEAAEPWSSVYENGGDLFQIELMGEEEAILALMENYECTDVQIIEALRSVVQRKVESNSETLQMDPDCRELLQEIAIDDDALSLSKSLFAQIGISVD